MVTVPDYSLRQVQLRPDVQQGVDVRTSAASFGADIGQGMQQIGRGLGQAADAMGQLQAFDEKMRARDAQTGFDREKIDLDYGENGYFTTQGRDAVDRREKYQRDLEDLKKKYGSTLKGGAARLFDDAATVTVTGSMRDAIVHSAQGRKDWAASSSTARLATFQDRALTSFADPKAVDRNIAAGFMEIAAQGDLMGWDADVLDVKRKEFSTGVYSSVALAMASKTGGASKALEYLGTKSDMMTTAVRMDLEAKLKPYADDEAALSVVDGILKTGRAAGAGAGPAAAGGTVGAGGPSNVRQRLYARAASAGKGKDAVDGLDEHFAVNLSAMFEDAPPAFRDGLQIGSGFRSEERQAQLFDDAVRKYGSPEAARKWVAPPGHSEHNTGTAVDIWYQGKRLDQAPAEVRQWVHDNAAAYGLRFPMSWESWHIEPNGARGGSTVVPARDSVSVRASLPSYDEAIAQVNEIQDPAVRASAMKQLNAQFEMRGKAEVASGQAAKTQGFGMVMQGVPVSQIPFELKLAMGREAVQGLMDYENKAGEITTDPVMLRNMTLYAATNPMEFATQVDLTAPEIINSLSKADLKSMIEKQASVLTDERKAKEEGLNVTQAMGWAKTQLEAVGITQTGIKTTDAAARQAMATREANFQMALLDEMRAWQAENPNKRITMPDVMSMATKLLMPVVLTQPGAGTFGGDVNTEGRLFDTINAPSNATYDIQVTITDIPRDLREAIRRDMMLESGGQPVPDEAVVQRYEDLQMGRAVPAPVNPAAAGQVTTTNYGIMDMLRGVIDRVDPPK